jgi:hypothetical protein
VTCLEICVGIRATIRKNVWKNVTDLAWERWQLLAYIICILMELCILGWRNRIVFVGLRKQQQVALRLPAFLSVLYFWSILMFCWYTCHIHSSIAHSAGRDCILLRVGAIEPIYKVWPWQLLNLYNLRHITNDENWFFSWLADGNVDGF